MEDKTIYDLIVLGTGPAGITAAIYAHRYNLNFLLIGEIMGGNMIYPVKVNNFPGFSEVSGLELTERFKKHLEFFNIKSLQQQVVKITENNNVFGVTTKENKQFYARNTLIALGTLKRRLNVSGEDKYIGRGVHYCATCDAIFYKNKVVAVVGGGDAANSAALMLSDIAQYVYQIVNVSNLEGDQDKINQLKSKTNVAFIFNNTIQEIKGNQKVEQIVLKNEFNNQKLLNVDGIFIEIGGIPNVSLLNNLGVRFDSDGFIIVNEKQETNISGIYAAGDITNTHKGFKQIVTAVSEGAIAAYYIYQNSKK